MWQRIILRELSAFLILKFVCSDLDPIFHRCCSLGRNKVFDPLKCESKIQTPIQGVAVEEQSLCLSTAALCCIQSLSDTSCKNGKTAAKDGRSCATEFRTQEDLNFKYCCEACKVGFIAGSMSMCHSKTFKFDSPWDQIYKSCCEEPYSDSIKTSSPATTSRESTNVCDLFPGELCQQICIPVNGSYRCQCHAGSSLLADGKTCRNDIGNRCERNNPCEHQCFDNGASVECSCNLGFILLADHVSCEDIDECRDGSHNCNLQTHDCINHAGSHRCELKKDVKPSIPPGFRIHPVTNKTVDIDECDNNPCNSYEICTNTIGSFICDCSRGFQRDGLTGACVDVNECQTKKHNCQLEFQRCDNTIGSFICVRSTGCGTGYTYNYESGQCDDDDECALGTHDCQPGYECKNLVGSFRCTKKPCTDTSFCDHFIIPKCPVGFMKVNGQCYDINECRNANVCLQGHRCQNTPGSFRCVSSITGASNNCGNGFRSDNSSNRCVDIDECTEQRNKCDHSCVNTYGSFMCFCKPGFLLDSDKRSCIDINECEVFKNRRLCAAFCINEPGSYKCSCPEGYKLGDNGASCVDIDECASQNRCTNPQDICVNSRGSYRCHTINCPVNYTLERGFKNRCVRVSRFCNVNDETCTKMPLSYSYSFISFVSNIPIPITGQLQLFYLNGPSLRSSSVEFSLELKSVITPNGLPKVTIDYFYLNHTLPNSVTLSLLKSVTGPQDIELHINMQIYMSGVYSGFTVSKLFISVSENEF